MARLAVWAVTAVRVPSSNTVRLMYLHLLVDFFHLQCEKHIKYANMVTYVNKFVDTFVPFASSVSVILTLAKQVPLITSSTVRGAGCLL